MKSEITYCGGACKHHVKSHWRKRLALGAVLFPWSLLLIPLVKALDFVAHAFGSCLGI